MAASDLELDARLVAVNEDAADAQLHRPNCAGGRNARSLMPLIPTPKVHEGHRAPSSRRLSAGHS